MEGISRKDIDKAVLALKTEGFFDIAEKIEKFDIIPKLYVYTYFKKVRDELKILQGDGSKIDPIDLEYFIDNNPKLQLNVFTDKGYNLIKRIQLFLNTGFAREGEFCDFNDSKFHSQTRFGVCQCESHEDEDEKPKEEELSPIYSVDEDTHKFTDEPEWWCKYCSDQCEPGDFEVSCDMESD